MPGKTNTITMTVEETKSEKWMRLRATTGKASMMVEPSDLPQGKAKQGATVKVTLS